MADAELRVGNEARIYLNIQEPKRIKDQPLLDPVVHSRLSPARHVPKESGGACAMCRLSAYLPFTATARDKNPRLTRLRQVSSSLE